MRLVLKGSGITVFIILFLCIQEKKEANLFQELAPPSAIQPERVLPATIAPALPPLEELSDEELKIAIFHNYLLSDVIFQLNHEQRMIRSQATRYLDPLAEALLQVDESAELLQRIWIPLYQKTFSDEDSFISASAVHSLKSLAQALFKIDPSGKKFERIGLPLFLAASSSERAPVREVIAIKLDSLAKSLTESEVSTSTFQKQYLPLWQNALSDPNVGIREEAVKSLISLTQTSIRADPSGNLFKEDIFPLIQSALDDEKIETRREAAKQLKLAQELGMADLAPQLLIEYWLQLYQEALQDLDLEVRKNARQNAGFYLKALLAKGYSEKLFEETWLPFFNDALILIDSGREAIYELDNLTLALLLADSSGNLYLEKGHPLLEEVLRSQITEYRASGALVLGSVAAEIAKVESAHYLLEEKILPLIKTSIKEDNEEIRSSAVLSLSSAAEASFAVDPTGKLFKEEFMPLIRSALDNEDLASEMAFYLRGLSRGALQAELPQKTLTEVIFPLLEENLQQEKAEHIRSAVAHGLSISAYISIEIDPSGKLLREHWFRLFQMAFNDPSQRVRDSLTPSFQHLSMVLSKGDIPIESLEKEWLPLLEETIINARLKNKPVLSSLLILAERFLEADPSGTLVRKKILPLYTHPSVIPIIDKNFEDYAQLLWMADPSGKLFRERWLPLWEEYLTSNSLHKQLSAFATMGKVRFFSQTHPFLGYAETLGENLSTRPSLQKDTETKYQLSVALLGQIQFNPRQNPTKSWKIVVQHLKSLRKLSDSERRTLSPWFASFSKKLRDTLSMKTGQMNRKVLEEVYKDYFETDRLPRKHGGPKDLLAHILLDLEANWHRLPEEYSYRLRNMKRPPSYSNLLPIIKEIAKGEAIFKKSIRGFHQWSQNVPEKKKSQYWGSVQKIFENFSLSRNAYELLGLWRRVVAILESYTIPESKIPEGKIKFLQRKAIELYNLIPQYVGKIFHFQKEEEIWDEEALVEIRKLLTQKEIHTVLYIANHQEFSKEEHPLNQLLRAYFKERVERASIEKSLEAFNQAYRSLPEMAGLFAEFKDYLDERKTGLRGPSAMEARVFLSGLSVGTQQRVEQWNDAERHLWELGGKLGSGKWKATLSELLTEISKNKNPSRKEVAGYLKSLQEWLKNVSERIPLDQMELYKTIVFHLGNVERFLEEETKEKPAEVRTALLPVREVTIYMEENPIETLHLGWPSLGNSCLDIVRGSYRKHAAGYLIHPAVRVVYIRDNQNPEKPLARVSVALDPKSKTLFLLSPIKTNSPYDYTPLIVSFMKNWARQLNVTFLAPKGLGYESETLGSGFILDRRKVSLPNVLVPFYSDLTGRGAKSWRSEIEGWVADRSLEELTVETPSVVEASL